MKKVIVVALLLFVLTPSVSRAETSAGVEFLTPLVQTIIHLLQDRIAVLQARVSELESQPQCLAGSSVELSLKEQIRVLDERIGRMKSDQLDSEKAWSDRRGMTGYEIDQHNKALNDGIYERQKLELQREALVRQLDLVR